MTRFSLSYVGLVDFYFDIGEIKWEYLRTLN